MTSDERIRAAFAEVARGLMAWQGPPLIGRREYRRLEGLRYVYKPYDPQGDVEPFDVQADWDERS